MHIAQGRLQQLYNKFSGTVTISLTWDNEALNRSSPEQRVLSPGIGALLSLTKRDDILHEARRTHSALAPEWQLRTATRSLQVADGASRLVRHTIKAFQL